MHHASQVGSRWIAACVVMFSGVLIGSCADDPTDDGPPRIEASIKEDATEADVFRTLGRLESVASVGIEEIELDMVDRRVVIKLSSLADVRPSERAIEMHEARNELLRALREPESEIRVTSMNWNPA